MQNVKNIFLKIYFLFYFIQVCNNKDQMNDKSNDKVEDFESNEGKFENGNGDDEDDENEEDGDLNMKLRYVDFPEDREFCEAFDRMTAENLMPTPGSTSVNLILGNSDNFGNTPRSGTLPTPDILQLAASKFQQPLGDDSVHKLSSVMTGLYSNSKNGENECKSSEDDSMKHVC